MRLIDADAFKKYMRGACEEVSHAYKDGGKWAKQITEDFCMDIDEQPTIEERKNGEWIDYSDEGYVECPFCHSATNCDDNIDELHFCFSCGAEMGNEQ